MRRETQERVLEFLERACFIGLVLLTLLAATWFVFYPAADVPEVR